MACGYVTRYACRRARTIGALLLILFPLVPPDRSDALDLVPTYYGSIDYSTGEYLFTRSTNSLYITNGITLKAGRFRFFGDIPVILQSTPWISFAGGDLIPTGGSQHENVSLKKRGRKVSIADTSSTSNVGIGDPQIGLDLAALEEGEIRPWVDLSAEIKIPLADVDQGFGTGAWDYGCGISLGKWLGENRVSAFLTYWLLGDLEDLPLKNALAYRLTWGHTLFDGKYDLQLSGSGSTESIQNADPPVRLSAGLDYEASPRTTISTDATVGLTESAYDFSISLGWRIEY